MSGPIPDGVATVEKTMYLLSLDTATNSGGLALNRNGEVVSSWVCKAPLRYSERMLDWIDFILKENRVPLEEIECLAVAIGPGSFTGIRVGLATVKALGQTLGKPVVGVSTLEALAARFGWASRNVAPMIDARRQQVFGAYYRVEGFEIHEISAPTVLPPAEWLRTLPEEPCLFVGDSAEFYRETVAAIRPSDRVHPSGNRILHALGRLAFYRFTRGLTSRPQELEAMYVRPSDAEKSLHPRTGSLSTEAEPRG